MGAAGEGAGVRAVRASAPGVALCCGSPGTLGSCFRRSTVGGGRGDGDAAQRAATVTCALGHCARIAGEYIASTRLAGRVKRPGVLSRST